MTLITTILSVTKFFTLLIAKDKKNSQIQFPHVNKISNNIFHAQKIHMQSCTDLQTMAMKAE